MAITKREYLAGLQCPLRLWLMRRRPEPFVPDYWTRWAERVRRMAGRPVKLSPRPDRYADEVAFGMHVGALRRPEVTHINGDYIRGETLEVGRLLVTSTVEVDAGAVAARIGAMEAVVAGPVPAVRPSRGRCFRGGLRCPHWGTCSAAGYDDGEDGEDGVDDGAWQALAGTRVVGPIELPDAPVSFLDFETLAGPVPYFPGTRPYEKVPFQFSLHHWDGGRVEHGAFLADGRGDPRPALRRALRRALRPGWPVMAWYASVERKALAEQLDMDHEVLDLWAVVKGAVVDERFGGSYSLKAVAPVLSPEVPPYAMDGLGASAAFEAILEGAAGQPGSRRRLLQYCGADTLNLVNIYRWLQERRTEVPPPARGRPPTARPIWRIVEEGLLAGLGTPEVLAAVLREHPGARTNPRNVSFYRHRMKVLGTFPTVAEAAEARAKAEAAGGAPSSSEAV